MIPGSLLVCSLSGSCLLQYISLMGSCGTRCAYRTEIDGYAIDQPHVRGYAQDSWYLLCYVRRVLTSWSPTTVLATPSTGTSGVLFVPMVTAIKFTWFCHFGCSFWMFIWVVRFAYSFWLPSLVAHFGCSFWLFILVVQFGCSVWLFILDFHFG